MSNIFNLPGGTRTGRRIKMGKSVSKLGRLKKKSLTKTIKDVIEKQTEAKFADSDVTVSAPIDWTGTILPLTNVIQNTTDTGRIGDKIKPLSILWNILIQWNGSVTAGTSINVVRIIIFRWKPFFADVAPTPGKILQLVGQINTPHSPLAHDGRNQFNVIIDKTIVFDVVNSITRVVKGSKKLKGDHFIRYKAASTTNSSNGLYIMYISDAVATVGPFPAVARSIIRINYDD